MLVVPRRLTLRLLSTRRPPSRRPKHFALLAFLLWMVFLHPHHTNKEVEGSAPSCYDLRQLLSVAAKLWHLVVILTDCCDTSGFVPLTLIQQSHDL